MNGQPARFGRGSGPESLRSKTTQQADCDRDARAASNAREPFENKPSSRTAYAAIAPCWRISVHNRPSLPFATIAANGRAQTQLLGCGFFPPPGGRPRWRTPIYITPPASLRDRDPAPDPVSEPDQDRTRIYDALPLSSSYNFVILDFVARH